MFSKDELLWRVSNAVVKAVADAAFGDGVQPQPIPESARWLTDEEAAVFERDLEARRQNPMVTASHRVGKKVPTQPVSIGK